MRRRRKTTRIVVHCSDTPASMDIGAKEIRRWHVEPKPRGNGWSDIGYHFVIRRDGTVEPGREVHSVGAHARGANTTSVGVCVVGGRGAAKRPEANYTDAQWTALELLCYGLMEKFNYPTLCGHRDLDRGKACPCFDVDAWWDTGEVVE